MHRFASLSVLVALMCLPARSFAEDIAAAKMHYERGTTLFDLQRYLEAAKEYESAFEAKNDPALLFNIGQAYRFGGDHSRAIAAFRSYLRRLPDAENRQEVQLRIAELQKLIDEQRRRSQGPQGETIKPAEETQAVRIPSTVTDELKPTAVAPTPTPSIERHGKHKIIAGISFAAAGVVLAVIGGAFEGLAKSQSDALSNPTPGTTFSPSREASLKTDEAIGAALLGVGGAALVTGLVVAVVGLHERKVTARASLTPVVSSHLMGMVINATF